MPVLFVFGVSEGELGRLELGKAAGEDVLLRNACGCLDDF